MQQIAEWLEELSLRQYAQHFAENDISFVILPDLTDEDLENDRDPQLGKALELIVQKMTAPQG